MRAPKKWKTWGAAAACVFLLQGCAVAVRGPNQEIPVTSHPSGAKIIVNGKNMGVTPLSLKLAKKKDHVIRIEKAGYIPAEIRAPSLGSGGRRIFVLGNFNWGWLAAMPGAYMAAGGLAGMSFGLGEGKNAMQTGGLLMLVGMAVGLIGSIAVDSSPADRTSFQFKDFKVTLQRIDEGASRDVATITLESWQYIKWIRIDFAGLDISADTILMQQ